jgi:plastocyanin
MKYPFVLVLACSVWLPGQAAAGEITGRVRITTTLTKKRVTLPQVYERHVALPIAAAAPPNLEDELRRTVIFLDTEALPARPQKAAMDQRQRRFEPEIIAVAAGSTVAFPNSDPIFHNVFSLSKVKSFDLGNYKMGESRTLTFTEPGVVQLHCHLHPNMTGAVFVTPNSWFTQPDSDGSFTLPAVPPGRYTVVAWHKSAGFFRHTVEVRAAQAPLSFDFEIPLAAAARITR